MLGLILFVLNGPVLFQEPNNLTNKNSSKFNGLIHTKVSQKNLKICGNTSALLEIAMIPFKCNGIFDFTVCFRLLM